MATETTLNQLVKGAPPPNTKVPPVAPLPSLANASAEPLSLATRSKRSKSIRSDHTSASSITDPALSLPSSPPQIYLNLLILEASLRSQYLHLLSRRRLNTFFLLLLGLWNGFFVWALFLKPREDGQGIGGSVYWVIETGERLAFMGGVVAALLVKATGQWERGIRWPRRWLGTTNRGLRGFNLRVVVVKGKWWREILSIFAFLLPFGLFRAEGGSNWHFIEREDGHIVEEDLSKGGDHIMLLPLPKNFSSEFRENWEAYRSEYWEKENEKRRVLRRKLKVQRRAKAKEAGGWKWWTGSWRLSRAHRGGHKKGQDLEKHPQHIRHIHSQSHSRSQSLTEKDIAMVKSGRRRSLMRDGSHSRQSSRSSTYVFPASGESDLSSNANDGQKPLKERVRRGSSVSSTSSLRRGTKNSTSRREGMLSPLTAADEDQATDDKDTIVREKRRSKRGGDMELRKSSLGSSSNNVHAGSAGVAGGGGGRGSRPTTPNSDYSDAFANNTDKAVPSTIA